MSLYPRGQEGEMVAHQVIGGGIAEPVVKLGRALQVGEHDRDVADFRVVARAQQGTAKRRKPGMAMTRSPVSASAAQRR